MKVSDTGPLGWSCSFKERQLSLDGVQLNDLTSTSPFSPVYSLLPQQLNSSELILELKTQSCSLSLLESDLKCTDHNKTHGISKMFQVFTKGNGQILVRKTLVNKLLQTSANFHLCPGEGAEGTFNGSINPTLSTETYRCCSNIRYKQSEVSNPSV